jgi:4-amino-4-deoxy-L-arabinose transferase-like glycosyltransferase
MESDKHGLRGNFDKWRLIFLIFLATYAALLLINLGKMPIEWDEVSHFNGGMLLLRGNFHEYLISNSFYPPVYDLFAAGFFSIGGISAFTGRLVSLTFSLLSVCAVFEFGKRMFGAKTALVASVFFAVMPGYVWLSRIALIETMLVFFFTVAALSFFWWLQKQQSKFLILSLVMLVSGVLVKYQMLIAGAVMLAGLVFLGKNRLKKLSRFSLLLLGAVIIAVPLIAVSYLYASHTLNAWIYTLNVGTADKVLYGMGINSLGQPRFPSWYYAAPNWMQTPIFYLLEMTTPYYDVHPISIVLYMFGLAGLALYAWRRKPADKYQLIWFIAVYVAFTAIPNKEWRYVTPLFPVLALSAASLLSSAMIALQQRWRNKHLDINRKRLLQASAILLAAVAAAGTAFSVADAVTWAARDNSIQIPLQESADFVGSHLSGNESVMVMMSQNLFSAEIVQFYLRAEGKGNPVYQYPENAVDAYTPDFNIGTFVSQCRTNNVKYVLMYEYGADVPYFNTTLTAMDVFMQLSGTGDFGNLPTLLSYGTVASGTVFGVSPRQIYVITFLG